PRRNRRRLDAAVPVDDLDSLERDGALVAEGDDPELAARVLVQREDAADVELVLALCPQGDPGGMDEAVAERVIVAAVDRAHIDQLRRDVDAGGADAASQVAANEDGGRVAGRARMVDGEIEADVGPEEEVVLPLHRRR